MRFPRPGNAAHNHRVAPTAATKKVNQIGRFIFNSGKHIKPSQVCQNVILSIMWRYLLLDTWHVQGMINGSQTNFCTAATQKQAPLTNSHGRLRWLMCSNYGLLAGALCLVMSTPTTRTLHKNVLPYFIHDMNVLNVYTGINFHDNRKCDLLCSQSAVMFSLPWQKRPSGKPMNTIQYRSLPPDHSKMFQ